MNYDSCILCPRMCGANRRTGTGFCGCKDVPKVARAALHLWEEPCISGSRGSGAVFFSGCTLKCVFCQNSLISHHNFGKEVSVERLSEIFLKLQEEGAHNINLISATQYLPSILAALDHIKVKLKIPVVLNCGGYERVETIRELKGYIDIYLPDFKYYDNQLAKKYSGAGDYFQKASEAIKEMIRQTGSPAWDSQNPSLLTKGVVLRHLVLPGGKEDSIRLINWIHDNLPEHGFLISLLSQYTPFHDSRLYPEINRRLTTYEYEKVLKTALDLGLTNGYMQKKDSAKEEYTPLFDLTGI